MTQRPDVWMPFYVADYLKDTRHLSTVEHGAYLLLLMSAWTSGGVLPDDERRLRRIAGLDEGEWSESGPVLLAFFRAADGGYRQKRIDQELERAEANLEQKRRAGRASAARRGSNARSTDVGTNVQRTSDARSTDVPTAGSTEGQREGNASPSPSPSPSPSTEPTSGKVATRSRPDRTPMAAPGPAALEAVMKAAGMIRQPIDHALLKEWLALPDMVLERDVLPVVERVAREVMERTGKVPFKLKLFDPAIREQQAADEASITRLKAITARQERMDREQAEARAAAT